MVARVHTVAFQGIEVLDIDVEVQMASGIIAFTVVGLPDKAVAKSRERVRGAPRRRLGCGANDRRVFGHNGFRARHRPRTPACRCSSAPVQLMKGPISATRTGTVNSAQTPNAIAPSTAFAGRLR
jgi:hypothetical protein